MKAGTENRDTAAAAQERKLRRVASRGEGREVGREVGAAMTLCQLQKERCQLSTTMPQVATIKF